MCDGKRAAPSVSKIVYQKKYSIPNVEGVFGRYRTRYHGYILLLVGAAQKAPNV